MGKEARKWVKAYSPLTGTDYAVHFSIADSVDDGNVLFMKQSRLAAEARVSLSTVKRVMATMLEAGLLERVEAPEQEKLRRACHNPLRFKLLFPVMEEVIPIAQPDPSEQDQEEEQDDSIATPDLANQDISIGHSDPPGDSIGQSEPSTPQSIGHSELATPNPIGQRDLSKGTGTCSATGTTKATGTRRAAPPPSKQLQLLNGSQAEPAVPADPEKVARRMLNDWWERQDETPQQNYNGARQAIAKALRDGWSERDVLEALDSVPIISGGAFDVWRSKRKGTNGGRRPQYGTGSRSADEIADAAVEEIADLMGYQR